MKALAQSTISHTTKAQFEWVVEHFSLRPTKTGEPITSPWFSDKSSNPKEWQMKIYLTGCSEDSKKYVSLFLHLNEKHHLESGFEIQLKLKLLNSKNVVLASSGTLNSTKLKQDYSFGIPKMLKIQDLFKDKNKFLSDDELHILCKIKFEAKETNTDSADLLPFVSNTDCYLIAHFQQLFNTKLLADVIIDVQGHTFEAHKLILSARSPVFIAMFKNDEKQTNTLEVNDITHEVFLEVLRFIYTDKVEKLDDMAPQLLAAADKYMLDLLKTKCEISRARNVTFENCGELLILADLHSAKDLKNILLDFVRCHSSEVAVTSNWQKLLETANPQLLRDISITVMSTIR